MRSIVLALATSQRIGAAELAPIVAPPLQELYKKIGKMVNKAPQLKNHARAVEDGLKLLQFFLQEDSPEWTKEQLAQVDYFGNKVLMERNDKWTAWYNVWRKQICQGLYDVVSAKFENGNPSSSDGGSFADNFKPGASAPTPVPEEEKKAPTKKAAPKKEEAKKARKPTKTVVKGKGIEACFFDSETLEFGESDVDYKTACNFIRSTKTNFIIKGKAKVVNMEGCKNCALIVDEVVTTIELINCEGVKVQVVKKTGNFVIDRCHQTELYLSEEGKNVKIHTTKATTTIINFPAAEEDEHGNDSRSLPIYETWETVIKGDKLESTPVVLE
jgi:hypothetical protein